MTSKPRPARLPRDQGAPLGVSGTRELPARGPGGVRSKGGVSSLQALAWNRRICRLDTNGQSNGYRALASVSQWITPSFPRLLDRRTLRDALPGGYPHPTNPVVRIPARTQFLYV